MNYNEKVRTTQFASRYCEVSKIRRRTKTLAQEKINFKGGTSLGDIEVYGEKGDSIRKLRRIIEKRVSQSLRKYDKAATGNLNRYQQKRWITNYTKNLYGFVPVCCWL